MHNTDILWGLFQIPSDWYAGGLIVLTTLMIVIAAIAALFIGWKVCSCAFKKLFGIQDLKDCFPSCN